MSAMALQITKKFGCFVNNLFRRTAKKSLQLGITGGIYQWSVDFLAAGYYGKCFHAMIPTCLYTSYIMAVISVVRLDIMESSSHLNNRPISQIPKCIRQISHNALFCNRNMHRCAHFCYKMVPCGIWDWCIVGFVWQVCCSNVKEFLLNIQLSASHICGTNFVITVSPYVLAYNGVMPSAATALTTNFYKLSTSFLVPEICFENKP